MMANYGREDGDTRCIDRMGWYRANERMFSARDSSREEKYSIANNSRIVLVV